MLGISAFRFMISDLEVILSCSIRLNEKSKNISRKKGHLFFFASLEYFN